MKVDEKDDIDMLFSDGRGDFFRSSLALAPRSCQASEGSRLEDVKVMDNLERYSLADSDNLAEREISGIKDLFKFINRGRSNYLSRNGTNVNNPGETGGRGLLSLLMTCIL